MFGFRRQQTRAQLMRAELGESFDHFKQAAGYAAGGLGQSMGPRIAAIRVQIKPANVREAATTGWSTTMAAMAPIAAMARDGTRQARKAQANQMMTVTRGRSMSRSKPSRKRGRRLVGLLAAGAAVGAVGAMMRRRRHMQWDEYDAHHALGAMESPKGAAERTMDKASAGVDKAMEAASRGAEKTTAGGGESPEKMPSAMESGREAAGTAQGQADRATGGGARS